MNPLHRGPRFWLLLVLALAGAAGTAALGFWQLDRAAQKIARQAAATGRARMPVLAAATLVPPHDAESRAALEQRAIELRGTWLADRTLFLDNRQMAGRQGYYVLTPLQLAGTDSVVLVQRGWAPRDFEQRTRLPAVDSPAGTVTVQGVLAGGPGRLFSLGEDARGTIRQNLDLNAFRVESGLPLADLMVVQTGPASDHLLREWPEPASDVARHYGYAAQWFALCALIAILFLWFQIVRPVLQQRARAGRDD